MFTCTFTLQHIPLTLRTKWNSTVASVQITSHTVQSIYISLLFFNLFSMNNRKLNSSHYCQSLIWTVLTSLSKPYLHFSLFFLVSKVKSLWFYYFCAWPCSNVARCTLRLCCRRHSSWTSCYRGVRFRCSRWFSTWGSGAGKGTRWWWFLLSVPCGSLTR